MINNINKIESELESYEPKYKKAYIIAMTPRSGSTMLCDLLDSSNLAGHPKEYLNPDLIKGHLSEYSAENSFIEYFEKTIKLRKTDNNVFGIKISYHQAKPYIEAGVFNKLLPDTKIINLFRRNILKQAISLYIAAKINYFHTTGDNIEKNELLKTIEFNKDEIFQRIKSIYLEEQGWIEYLDKNSFSYMKLFYEDNIINIDQSVKTILSYIGLDCNDFSNQTFSESKFKKISTDINDDFYSLFMSNVEIVKKTLSLGITLNRLEY